MKIIELVQGTPEWVQWRNSGIGASDISVCTDCNPYKKKKSLFLEKSNMADGHTNSFMRRGQMYEGEALLTYCMDKKCHLKPVCVESEENPIYRASLDGYGEIAGKKMVLEIKVPTSPKLWEEVEKGSIPDYYLQQVQWQIMVSEADYGIFIVYNPENERYLEKQVQIDLDLQKRLKEAANEFWGYFSKGLIPPDGLESIESDNLKGLLESAQRIKEEIARLQDALYPLEEQIKSFAHGEGFRAYGYTCKQCHGRTTYDYNAMAQDGIDLGRYLKTGKPFYTLKKEK